MRRYAEAAWLGRFGSLFPSKTTWLDKSLNGIGVIEPDDLELANYYDNGWDGETSYDGSSQDNGVYYET